MNYVEIVSVSHSQVAGVMGKMDAGIFFYKPTFSRKACSPTKLGEFWACGLPCLSNSSVGDLQELFTSTKAGILVHDFSESSLNRGIDKLLELCSEPDIRDRCSASAERYFSLETGVERYLNVYKLVKDEKG
jgi:glycosyltransferase involved in cell wall biosynthesis